MKITVKQHNKSMLQMEIGYNRHEWVKIQGAERSDSERQIGL